MAFLCVLLNISTIVLAVSVSAADSSAMKIRNLLSNLPRIVSSCACFSHVLGLGCYFLYMLHIYSN